MAATLAEVRTALLAADVHFKDKPKGVEWAGAGRGESANSRPSSNRTGGFPASGFPGTYVAKLSAVLLRRPLPPHESSRHGATSNIKIVAAPMLNPTSTPAPSLASKCKLQSLPPLLHPPRTSRGLLHAPVPRERVAFVGFVELAPGRCPGPFSCWLVHSWPFVLPKPVDPVSSAVWSLPAASSSAPVLGCDHTATRQPGWVKNISRRLLVDKSQSLRERNVELINSFLRSE